MTVLVTGATGRHGGTGAYVVRRLREHGIPVRALVRRLDERSERAAALGAELVVGDLADHRSLASAVDGVSSVYFTFPVDAGIVPAAANYAQAVRETGGSPRTVVMSMGPATPTHPSHLGRHQWLSEQVLQWAGLDVTILRMAAMFHEDIPLLWKHSVRTESMIRNCFGENPVSWLNALDAAEFCVAALLRPELFADKAAHYLPGPEVLDFHQITKVFGEVLDRPVGFEPISREAWLAELLDLAASPHAGLLKPDMARHITACGHAVANSLERGNADYSDTGLFRRVTGREPVLVQDFLTSNADLFRPER
ncbi:NAD(P)H-binding protein [Kutzneria sp. 744]|uniref:NmrA family NAD(P)-binding protein n=1 Tax=Kutzneria sp. (strain 744) TaxID=345341 RepID=UPI0004B25073|nr:NAD(P)H-binding protein [Kutzneria sp. 744]